jgi:DNA-3-methyladenine glycosylase
VITETEAYRGKDDLACHASKGKTNRTAIMFEEGGYIYMYLIYGMYWMLNIVTSGENDPQAVLIRGLHDINGPGRITRSLGLDNSFYAEDLSFSKRIWIEEGEYRGKYICSPRIGIGYAGEPWKNMPWRYLISD